MGKVRFALAGCGSIAGKHAEAIGKVGAAELKAICDPDRDRMKNFAAQYGGEEIPDFRTLLKEDVDVISICTPSALHASMAREAMRAGKHVLVEKPMALTLEDAEAMIEEGKKAGVQLGVVLQNRFKPAVAALKKALDGGYFGKLTHGTAIVRWNRNQEYYRNSPWRGKTSQGGGVLMNQAIHNIDLLQWLMGPADAVLACTAHRLFDLEAEDVAAGIVRFKNGALGIVETAATIYPHNLEESIGIFGETGTAIIGGTRADTVRVWQFAHLGQELAGEIATAFQESRGHLPCIEDMVKAVTTGTKPLIDGNEGKKSLQLVLAFHQSARTQKSVAL